MDFQLNFKDLQGAVMTIKLNMSCVFAENPFFIPSASIQVSCEGAKFTLAVEGDSMRLRNGEHEIELKERTLCHMLKYHWDENKE